MVYFWVKCFGKSFYCHYFVFTNFVSGFTPTERDVADVVTVIVLGHFIIVLLLFHWLTKLLFLKTRPSVNMLLKERLFSDWVALLFILSKPNSSNLK